MAERKIEFASKPVALSVEAWVFCEPHAPRVFQYPGSPRKYEISNKCRIATILEAVLAIRKDHPKVVGGHLFTPSFRISEWLDGRQHLMAEASVRISKDGSAMIDDLMRSTRVGAEFTAELQALERETFVNPDERPAKLSEIYLSDTWGRFFSTLLDALYYLQELPGRAVAIKILESDLAHPEIILQNAGGQLKVLWLI